MKIKPKPCKGTGKAKNFKGCGGETLVRTYGLCGVCFNSWLYNTAEGKQKLLKTALKHVKQQRVNKKKVIKKKKVSLLSADAYRKKYIQPKINKAIRLIDYGQKCIATGNGGQIHAGHYFATGSNRTLTYHAHNIFAQSAHSNNWKGGDDKKYRQGLIDTFGESYLNWIETLPKHPLLKLSKPELIELNTKLNDFLKTIAEVKRTPLERIEERNRMNLYLNIYEKDFMVYLH